MNEKDMYHLALCKYGRDMGCSEPAAITNETPHGVACSTGL
eukprot:CAMPEP_0119111786 /NCGR_PEP_ID=MMETSP1180-20130426/37355_1 /TAXON_ID=3052 ORGANISM="Chlamydomonas cf sp, Strain CCMP681" /NCGR_SAMPLE_ID=MMETSP1180 /ASSEMBLY_ACC=CAM_ASM_000741 /LENGTH=40 /DNA_ID= /DNA_START= /DNA_END= /DNA_ORIENTATION=